MSHGYYSHSYAEMQSSSRFCRKNGVCVVPTYPLGKAMNLFPRQKRDGKNPETQAAESVPLLAALAMAQQVRERKCGEMEGTLQRVSSPAPPTHGCLHFQRTGRSQLTTPKWQLRVLFSLALYHYTRRQQTFAHSAAEVTFTAVSDTCLRNRQLCQKELEHESSVLLQKPLRCLWTTPCCLRPDATLLEQDCVLCCQQFSHCHSIVRALKQSLTLQTLRKAQIVKKPSKPSHMLLLNGLWLSKLTTWLQCPPRHMTEKLWDFLRVLRLCSLLLWWEEPDFCSWSRVEVLCQNH